MNVKVCIIKEKEEKKYLADLIGDEFQGWQGKKVLLTAPTGLGKTTFMISSVLPYCKRRRRKMLILCNRRLLRLQYWQSLVKNYSTYAEIQECVELMTYQELAEAIKRQKSIKKILYSYETIVCDECHYFYADADFNGLGTYVLLQEFILACVTKTVIFMSATMTEVEPLIEQTIKNAFWKLRFTECNEWIKEVNSEILKYDFSELADYERFQCVCVPDWESLQEIILESQKKTVIFLNNKEKGKALAERLIRTGKIEKKDIEILNSDNLDEDGEVVQNLAIGNTLKNKILITTSVLDNGVSIHDPEVGNLVVETESKIEFLQMIGRIRRENTNECKLYFVLRDKKNFSCRMKRYEDEIELFSNLKAERLKAKREYYIQTMWCDDEDSKFFRKALVWMNSDSQVFDRDNGNGFVQNHNSGFFVNRFAEKKIGDMYVAESHFYGLALSDPLSVIYEQMTWIGKRPEELKIIESEYKKRLECEFVAELQRVQKFSAEELKQFKIDLTKKFRKDFFIDVPAKNGTISNEKLQDICGRFGLVLLSEEDVESRRKLYTIQMLSER